MKLLLSLIVAASAANTSFADPVPVQVTYTCVGTAKAYFRRALYDGTSQQGKGFSVTGYPKIENTELAILNAQGLPEFLIHPDLAECGCLPDDQIYFQQFGPNGVRKWYALPGTEHLVLSDGSGTLDCQISLTGLN